MAGVTCELILPRAVRSKLTSHGPREKGRWRISPGKEETEVMQGVEELERRTFDPI